MVMERVMVMYWPNWIESISKCEYILPNEIIPAARTIDTRSMRILEHSLFRSYFLGKK